jgi:hypothetical protein
MHELTYRDYIKYLEVKMNGVHVDALSLDERKYFKLVKKQLDAAPSLPSYILDEPLLLSKEYDEETLLAIMEIRNTISIHGRVSNLFENFISNVKQRLSILLASFRPREIVGVVIGVVFFVIVVFMLLNLPAGNMIELFGAAGLTPSSTTVSPDTSNISPLVSVFPMGCMVGAIILLISLFVLLLIGKKND